jgi:hypothetical protein
MEIKRPLETPPTAFLKTGSPSKLKGRTFRAMFHLPAAEEPQRSRSQKATRTYRNPVVVAQEWQRALQNGAYSSAADLARKLGVSRARVTQVLHLLKLERFLSRCMGSTSVFLCGQALPHSYAPYMRVKTAIEPDVLNAIVAFDDPLPSRSITERMLKSIVHHSAEEQRREL